MTLLLSPMPCLTDSLDNALLGQIIEFSRKICVVVIIIITSNTSIEKPQWSRLQVPQIP